MGSSSAFVKAKIVFCFHDKRVDSLLLRKQGEVTRLDGEVDSGVAAGHERCVGLVD